MRYLFADCLFDTQCYLLRRAGQSIQLRPKVFQVLTYLLTDCDRVIPKHELCEQVWSAQGASDTTIETCLRALRQAIGDTGQAQRLIKTHYGHGYRFVAAVTMAPDDGAPAAPEAVAGLSARAALAGQAPPASLDASCLLQSCVPLVNHDPLPLDEWKVVTVLGCALVPPARQGTHRCLETWHRRLQTLHELTGHAAQEYGGLVRALGGEGVLMVFGAPVAQEDHAQRAVLTALGIQRHLSAWQTARASPEAAALQVRMGLHTGRVAVGDSGVASERGAVVVGETVTRAVALQAYAASGTILCSETTAHGVQRVVRLKAMALESVDGPATLGRIYKVVGQRRWCASAVPLTARTGTPFVGRAQELATLHAVWADVTQGQRSEERRVGKECRSRW